jgi:signal recognition particle GTPase
VENDRLLEKIKEYFDDQFNEQNRKLEAIETKLTEMSGQLENLKKCREMDNLLLQAIHKGGMSFLLRLEALQKYIQQLARLNKWKLPEKQKIPEDTK